MLALTTSLAQKKFMKLKIIILLMALPCLTIGKSYSTSSKKILIVVSSYGKSEGKTRPGFEFDEFSQAYLIFNANGFEVDVASPRGGHAEPDGYNESKPYNKILLQNSEAMHLLWNTKPTGQLKPEDYSAVYIVGGKGAMFDLPFDSALQDIILAIYQKQAGVVAAVCHGPAALVNVKINDTTFLVTNKRMTGFSNEEEDKFGKKWKSEFPFLLEDKLNSRGAMYERSDVMLPQVSVDGRLITGQNPYSTTQLAEEMIRALGFNPISRELYPDERSMQLTKRALNGDIEWAKSELLKNHSLFDIQLIGVYGYYQLLYAKDNQKQITSALEIIELITPLFFDEKLQYEMAKAYLKIKDKPKAKSILKDLIEKKPSFLDARKLMDELSKS